MKEIIKAPLRRWLAVSTALFATGLSAQTVVNDAGSEDPTVELSPLVVTPTRTPHAPVDLPGSVTLLTPGDWQRSQTLTLAGALRSVPGVAVISTGAAGAQTSLFLRGSAPHQMLFLVDGVRVNDRGAFYQNFLGGADLTNTGRIEIVRGPQSVLYGGSAMGGVVSIETQRGEGPPSGRLDVEGGSFSTLDGSVTISGSTRGLGYSAANDRFETANDRPGNHFDSTTWSARLDWEDGNYPGFEVGVTARGMKSTYAEPGARGPFPFPGVVDFKQTLATAFARYHSGALRAHLILADQERDYSFTSAYGSTPVESRRRVVDLQLTANAADGLEITAGANYEPSQQKTPGELKKEKLRAEFISLFWKPVEGTSGVVGVRHDDYNSVGGHSTWRAGVSHTLAGSGTTLHAMYGTAFTAPSLDDRYGNLAFFQPASPGIQPEHSHGWEVGVEQTLSGGKGTVSATWFANRYRDLFGYDPDTFATVNVGRAKSEGVELAGEFKPCDTVRVLAAYTWTDAEDTSDGSRLPRRPGHVATVDVQFDASRTITLGAGLRWMGDRVDVGPVDQPDYATLRIYGSWQATPYLRAHVRMENLLDRQYEEVVGYPALGIGAYGGLTLQF